MKIKCPKCQSKYFWQLSDHRIKCKNCRYRFSKPRSGFLIKPRLLKQIISEFLLEHSTNVILDRVDVSKRKLLKTLILLRIAMTRDIPEIFSGVIEVDETYLGGQRWSNEEQENQREAKIR